MNIVTYLMMFSAMRIASLVLEAVKGRFHKTIINMIFIVILLLALCIAVDYATNATNETTVTNMDQADSVLLNDSIVVNDTYYVSLCEDEGNAKFQKVVTVKPKVPTVTITCKPSCGCGRHSTYIWRTRTFVDHCPHCHKYGTLRNVHKWQARYEQELTCDPKLGGCGADYCGNCGHEKYSYSKYYLRRA